MIDQITHRAFFGTAKHDFTLTDEMILELEASTGAGVGLIIHRLMNHQFNLAELTEVLRLGLIGGGMDPEQAMKLCATYAKQRPIAEILPLALDVINARWLGPDQEAAA